jgi:signal peptidase I
MNIDVGFWLTLALLVCVLTWVADRIWKFRQREESSQVKKSAEFVISLLPVFLVVLVIRSFIAEPFNIPSGSMIPTLKINDFIVVNKFSYGLRLPVVNTKFLDTGEPKHGDVMVFRFPRDPSIHFIKRVIGLPGDSVAMHEGHLYLNGQAVPQTKLRDWVEGGVYHELLVENLDGRKHLVQRLAPINPYTGKPEWRHQDGEWTVPPGHYFMMGDNRDDSNDSRFWGTVPENLVEGRAFLIWMHLDSDFPWVDFSRDGRLDKEENFK